MYNYKLGLLCGGLMEDPKWHLEEIIEIKANNLKDAKNNWARYTGLNKLKDWNAERQTYFGWNIKVVETDDISVPMNQFLEGKVNITTMQNATNILQKISELQEKFNITKEKINIDQPQYTIDNNLNILEAQIDILKWVLGQDAK